MNIDNRTTNQKIDFGRIDTKKEKKKKDEKEKVVLELSFLEEKLFFNEIYQEDFKDEFLQYYLSKEDIKTLKKSLLKDYSEYIISEENFNNFPEQIEKLIKFIKHNFNDIFFKKIDIKTLERDIQKKELQKEIILSFSKDIDKLKNYIELGFNYSLLSDTLKANKEIATLALKTNKEKFENDIHQSLLEDKEFLFQNSFLIKKAPLSIKYKFEVIKFLIENEILDDLIVFNTTTFLSVYSKTKELKEKDFLLNNINHFLHDPKDIQKIIDKNLQKEFFSFIKKTNIIESEIFLYNNLLINIRDLKNNEEKYSLILNNIKLFDTLYQTIKENSIKINITVIPNSFLTQKSYFMLYKDVIDLQSILHFNTSIEVLEVLFNEDNFSINNCYFLDDFHHFKGFFSFKKFLLLLKKNPSFYDKMDFHHTYLLKERKFHLIQKLIDKYFLTRVIKTKSEYFLETIEKDKRYIKRYPHYFYYNERKDVSNLDIVYVSKEDYLEKVLSIRNLTFTQNKKSYELTQHNNLIPNLFVLIDFELSKGEFYIQLKQKK